MNPQDELDALVKLFPNEQRLFERAEHVSSASLPEPYKSLLAHYHHMTVTMEEYHKTSVDVTVLDQRLDENVYSRQILLSKSGTDDVVQFGIVRFNFDYVTQSKVMKIEPGQITYGRLATIFCNQQPAIDLLEVSAPLL